MLRLWLFACIMKSNNKWPKNTLWRIYIIHQKVLTKNSIRWQKYFSKFYTLLKNVAKYYEIWIRTVFYQFKQCVNVSGTFNHYFGSPDKLTKLILFVTRVPLILAVFPFLFFCLWTFLENRLEYRRYFKGYRKLVLSVKIGAFFKELYRIRDTG